MEGYFLWRRYSWEYSLVLLLSQEKPKVKSFVAKWLFNERNNFEAFFIVISEFEVLGHKELRWKDTLFTKNAREDLLFIFCSEIISTKRRFLCQNSSFSFWSFFVNIFPLISNIFFSEIMIFSLKLIKIKK